MLTILESKRLVRAIRIVLEACRSYPELRDHLRVELAEVVWQTKRDAEEVARDLAGRV